ncbi:ATP-binding protein [Streptomyces sp. B6B3]|uniref:sensor histidine kinase n=1 Tax=Streptomyces sp. B6B3 TaxID=3153570 RepID=UPI00325F7557
MTLRIPGLTPVFHRIRARYRPSRVRMRLSLLYAGAFTGTGAVLLAILYLLVSHSPKTQFSRFQRSDGNRLIQGSLSGNPSPELSPLVTADMQAAAEHQHDLEMEHLLVQSAIALCIMVLISFVLGWLVANRILRPLRVMTSTIQRISARNLHERLAAPGPRDEMVDLSDTVDGLLERLETALATHKRFVANAAHELRTPLTLEHALIEETLIDRTADVASFRAASERVLEICRQQERLLESLLTLTTGERGLDRREPVDLAEIAEDALDIAESDFLRRDVRRESTILPAVTVGDRALVERLVTNLVENALTYNVPDGFVEVRTGTEDGRAVITVSNSGHQVPDDQVSQLFEPFHRLDRRAGRGWNHGLGLSIVRAIASAHGAALAAEARPGGGLAVRVAFPVPVELRGPRPPAVAGGARQRRPALARRG